MIIIEMIINTINLCINIFIIIALSLCKDSSSYSSPSYSSPSSVLSSLKCQSSDFYPLRVLHSVTPRDNSSSGVFTKFSRITDIVSCVNECCRQSQCDSVLFYNDTLCFHITCRSSHSCQPIKRTGLKYAKSSMVMVRSSDSYVSSDDFDSGFSTIYDNDKQNHNENEIINNDNDDYDINKHRRDNHMTLPIDSYAAEDTRDSLITNVPLIDEYDGTCQSGTKECPVNEICVLKNNRKRRGICECETGFIRNLINKRCERMASVITPEPKPAVNVLSLPPPSTPAVMQNLVVSAGENRVIQLPQNEITLSVFVVPSGTGTGSSSSSASTPDEYKYLWTLVSNLNAAITDFGIMEGSSSPNLKLSKLKAGNYSFKVMVTAPHASGETIVNVTVLPPQRVNRPPVAIIQPINSTVQLPNKDTVLDGSYSTDDDKIVKFEWQTVTVPIGYKNIPDIPMNAQTLQLKNLVPGFYQFNLTITDSNGANNSTIANITVLKEIDYPPRANAGSDVVIYLPQNEVTLAGNLSTDDKGIIGWQWTRAPESNASPDIKSSSGAVDMDGTSTPFLHLSKLEVGVYKFILKVIDTANQTSTAEIHVFVKPENNSPPVAVVNDNLKFTLPITQPVTIDGSKSHDDVGIVKWQWRQIKGPKQIVIIGSDRPKANLTKLIPGDYVFQLTVFDAKNLNSSANVTITVIQTKNTPPVANAGGNHEITLPDNRQVIINGSASYDDVEIIQYHWERAAESLAAGDVMDNSSFAPILRLANLVPGRYVFKLTVTDGQMASNSDTVSLIVKQSPQLMNHVEIRLNVDIKSFTADQQINLLKRLELLLNEFGGIRVDIIKLDATTQSRRVRIVFVVYKTSTNELISGKEIAKQLKQKLRTDSSLITPPVLNIDTVVCQNECSRHGTCDQYTKRCLCEAFWMEDPIRIHFGDGDTNCDWSILYVIVITFTVMVSITALFWTCVCCISKFRGRKLRPSTGSSRRYRKGNRVRYTLLEDDYSGDGAADSMELMSNVKKLNYFSDADTESDTLFDTTRRNNLLNNKLSANSHPQKHHQKSLNGLIKDIRKVKA